MPEGSGVFDAKSWCKDEQVLRMRAWLEYEKVFHLIGVGRTLETAHADVVVIVSDEARHNVVGR